MSKIDNAEKAERIASDVEAGLKAGTLCVEKAESLLDDGAYVMNIGEFMPRMGYDEIVYVRGEIFVCKDSRGRAPFLTAGTVVQLRETNHSSRTYGGIGADEEVVIVGFKDVFSKGFIEDDHWVRVSNGKRVGMVRIGDIVKVIGTNVAY